MKVTDIGVWVKDETVAINGYATTYNEKPEAVREFEKAERPAWAAPGVFSVDNNLTLGCFGFDA
ncbi:BON domain-containing protein [Calothrix sp. UHCC 0171]|nr:BON domain-containing protein [Calothrix sp. UHCC 0171]MEA5573649.1 BON domain-containing protein [Calothrix sp. UHCC 0171]